MTEINTLLNQARLICVRRIRPRSLILPLKDRTLSLLKRTRMRKYFVIPLMLLALLASAACGDDSPEEVIPPTETPDQPAAPRRTRRDSDARGLLLGPRTYAGRGRTHSRAYRGGPLSHRGRRALCREPQNDDAGIPAPRNAGGVEDWLQRLGFGE